MPSTSRRISTLRWSTFAALLATALAFACLLATNANAADGPQYGSIGQYGQVARFGGFDSTAYDGEKYDKGLTEGKLLNPVGFAVDTKDTTAPGDTAIYVLDRVSDWGDELTGSTPTEWRLQKLSDTGAVLGATEFTLPNPAGASSALGVNSPTGVLGLAIDDNTKTIYTLLYATVGSGNSATPEAEEIIDWSTTPNGSKQLVAPGTLSSITPVSPYTAPGLLGTSSNELTSASPPLYDPQGLALDVTGGQDDLAIEADKNVRSANGAPQGPAVVGQVPTSGASAGSETGSWSAETLTDLSDVSPPNADADAVAAGISTNSNGSLEVLLNPTIGSSLLNAIDLSAGLTSPAALAASGIDPSNGDAAPLVVANSSGNHPSAGGQAVELSNGLYASDFYENTAGAGYWEKGANEGIRLVSPELGGQLSNPFPPATSIFDTLGNATSGSACNIGNGGAGGAADGVSLAAGANGTVWVLTSGQDSSAAPSSASDAAYTTGREVIELSPGAGSPCAGPTGTFELNGQPASSPLTVPVGSTVDFNASSIAYPTSGGADPASVYAYEWDPTGSGSFTTVSDTLAAPGDFGPSTTASYQYTTPGVYTAELELLGDFGVYDQTGTVVVQATSPPTAALTGPTTAQTGQSVTFSASGSQPASGAQIADYHWSFGDGATDDTQSATDSHAYASAGTYTVTLTVRDNDEQTSTGASQQITVTSPSSGGGGSGGTTTTTTTQSGSTTTTPTTATTATSKPKALTTAQKLANALKACKKKPKKQRASCEKQAKKKYAKKPKPKPKPKKKKK